MSRQTTVNSLMKIDKILSKTVEIICVLLLIATVTTISVSIFTRFVIFYPLNFADALGKYMMMWMAFLGSGLAIKAGEHIAVDMFMDKLNAKNRKILLVIIDVLISIFLIFLIYYGWIFALSGKGSHDPFVFGISMMIPYLSVPVGFAYILVQLNITTILRVLKEDPDPAVKEKSLLPD
ncbi:TRAP transporter small permease [Virgibacillus doumboii]|uniref:TRAP transporter small permease n=1 Tax=Virgibacillus doumboii TaxID=2697503 RepID=UPI0013DF3111|nr:TRAP transporter small permease [Virgibacillus doumboii]